MFTALFLPCLTDISLEYASIQFLLELSNKDLTEQPNYTFKKTVHHRFFNYENLLSLASKHPYMPTKPLSHLKTSIHSMPVCCIN